MHQLLVKNSSDCTLHTHHCHILNYSPTILSSFMLKIFHKTKIFYSTSEEVLILLSQYGFLLRVLVLAPLVRSPQSI